MLCPACRGIKSVTLATRTADGGLRRRRKCTACGSRFTTFEQLVATHSHIPDTVVVSKRELRTLLLVVNELAVSLRDLLGD